ncbi:MULTISPECIES: hypothetical protein [unclassified Actinomyces]|uniref:hypothetical protein n=1 Tax=unclassified Actinomyces TaxID=2609248 RepID=UPI000D5A0A2B|nr:MULTISPECIES: hypothetical protein [unclassified Actinomyces]RAX22636.1 hypothetical protein DRB07_07345 [Actinomyces sp. Z3]
MCRKVTCKRCGKPTWAGCGQHIEQALAGVPKSQRCQGHDDKPAAPATPSSFLRGLFGRK